MSFLGSLPYTGHKKELILDLLSRFAGVPVDEELLERRLIAGNCLFYDAQGTLLGSALECSDKAARVIIDSGLADGRSNNGDVLGVTVLRNNGAWTSGFVDTIAKLQQNMADAKVAAPLSDAEVQKQRLAHVQRLIVPDRSLDAIFDAIVKPDTSWTKDAVRNCLCQMAFYIRTLLDNNTPAEGLEAVGIKISNGKILFHSGFLSVAYRPMYVIGDIIPVTRADGSTCSAINNICMAPSDEALLDLGFTSRPCTLGGESMKFSPDIAMFDTEDAWHFFHALKNRAERLPEKAQALAYQPSVRKLCDSVELAVSLEKAFGGFIVPFFHNKSGSIQYFLPLYMDDEPELAKPDAAIVIGYGQDGKHYGVKTIFTLADAAAKARISTRYKAVPWLDLTISGDEEADE